MNSVPIGSSTFLMCEIYRSQYATSGQEDKKISRIVTRCIPRVEVGKNTSTVIPASRKGREKGKRIRAN
jgi:hypothetical protein